MRAVAISALLLATLALPGCIAYDVASTTVGAATSVVGTAVDVTGDVAGAAASTVTGGSSDKSSR